MSFSITTERDHVAPDRKAHQRKTCSTIVHRTVSTRRKILLVDDSALVRAVVVHALSASGFEVSTVDDPRRIDDAVAKDPPDLLLVDATFPGVSDDMLVETIIRHVSQLPVVIFSDRAEAEIQGLVERSGARGFVPKDGATLGERLTAYLAAS
jgi:DNA-binding response OmpR family regulator